MQVRERIRESYYGLDAVIECMAYVEERCKQDGLSKDLAYFLQWYIVRTLVTAKGVTHRMVTIQFRPSCNQTKNPELFSGFFVLVWH